MSRYPDVANPALLERLPLDAMSLLDVGCGAGALGAAYRKMNPRARLYGIEEDPAVAAIARGRLDHVAVADVETNPVPFTFRGGVDCIVYGDVLEHLRDPWAVLRRHLQILSPHGTVVICVPNIEHWSFIARLLRGDWDYTETGLLDRTHLRWFTGRSMREGLERAGLAPCDVVPLTYDAAEGEAFVAAAEPLLGRLAVETGNYRQRALPLQYLWRARRATPEPMHICSTMLEHVGGVSQVRVVNPMRAIASEPGVITHVIEDNQWPALPASGARIMVLHRPVLAGPEGIGFLRDLLRTGMLVITEFDDHPSFFPALRRPDVYAFSGVHAVQTSTPSLAESLRIHNTETRVFPNGIWSLPEVRNFRNPERLSVFFGGINREPDWRAILPALNEAAAAAGERLSFEIMHDDKLFDALETPHKNFTPTADYDTYLETLGRCEISLMPLLDTAFNRAKSDLKFIEAGACRVAALASPVVYADTIEDGRTGLLFRTPEELRMKLLRLVATPDAARALGDAARTYVSANRMIAYQVADRLGWYRELWERRAELTEALYRRVPELRP